MTDPTTLSLPDLARWYAAWDGWRWGLPWCSMPDEHGRVWRRNCCRTDPGFGWTQVLGRTLREPRDRDVPVDLEEAGSKGALLQLVSEVLGGPVSVDHEVHGEVGVTLHTRETRTYVGSASGPTLAHALAALVVEVRRG